jgi:hypothetical protein
MKTHCLSLVGALLIAAAPITAWAQAAAPASTAAPTLVPLPAAAPITSAKPTQKLLTPEQKRERAALPDDSQPAGPALEKITIPLGKNSPGPSYSATGTTKSKTTGGVNDSVARCESLVDKQERTKCLDKIGR